MKMYWVKLKRIARSGFFNFWRNATVSLASVLVMMVTLVVIGFVIFAGSVLDASLSELRSKVDVNVTFLTNAPEEDILSIKSTLESLPEVSLVTYVSREEALEAFRARHEGDELILAALDELGDNPLGATLNIKATSPSQYESVAQFLQSDRALSSSGEVVIDKVNYFQNKAAIDKLTEIINSADRLGFFTTLLFIFISVLIAFNTIRLTIYIARDEIAVMRLVGASIYYIQGPFVVLGVIYGLVAAVLALILFVPLTYWLGSATENFFTGPNVFQYYIDNFPQILLIILISGIAIGALSSSLAIRKYLRN